MNKRELKKMYNNFSSTDLESKITRKELESYIKNATDIINAAYPTMSRASAKDVQKAMYRIGVGKKPGTLGYNTNFRITKRKDLIGKSKGELLEHAKTLKSIIKGDRVSDVAEQFEELRLERAYSTFTRSGFGIEGISKEEYKSIVESMGSISDVLTKENYGSAQVRQLMEDYSDVGYQNIADIVRDAHNKFYKTSGTVSKYRKNMTKYIVTELKKARKK